MTYNIKISYSGVANSEISALSAIKNSAAYISPNCGIYPSYYDGSWYAGDACVKKSDLSSADLNPDSGLGADDNVAYINSTCPPNGPSLYHDNVAETGIPATKEAYATAKFPAYKAAKPLEFAINGSTKEFTTEDYQEVEFYTQTGIQFKSLGFSVTITDGPGTGVGTGANPATDNKPDIGAGGIDSENA